MDPEKSNFEQLEGIEVSHEKSELTLEQKKNTWRSVDRNDC